MAWSARPDLAQVTIAVNVSARQFRQPDFVQQVFAEGMETRVQRDALEALGCLNYHGYWIGRPGPVAALEGWTGPAPGPMA